MATRKPKTPKVSSAQSAMSPALPSIFADVVSEARTAVTPKTRKPRIVFDAEQPCPWRINGKRCGKPVSGVDPMRTCQSCQAAGAPVRVPWEMAKPDNSSTVGESVVVLANIKLVEQK